MMRSSGGFTILELLIAVAITALLLGGIGVFMAGTMKFSSNSIGTADDLEELNNVSGYLLDQVRTAREVAVGDCSGTTPSYPCVSLVVPRSRAGGDIDAYERLVFEVVPRDTLSSEVRTNDAWADANTAAVVEYRTVLCASPSNPCDPAAVSGYSADLTVSGADGGPYLVMDRLMLGLTAWSYSAPDFTLEIQVARKGRLTPASGPYSVTIEPRNVTSP